MNLDKDDAPFDELCSRLNSRSHSNSTSNGYSAKGLRPIPTERFEPHSGSDERQYCSPGFNLPVSQMSRLVYGKYPEYHTSLDNKALMGIDTIIDSADQIERLLHLMDKEIFYVNLKPSGEPKLGDLKLYPTLNFYFKQENQSKQTFEMQWFSAAIMNLLCWSDGSHSLKTIARRSRIAEKKLRYTADVLMEKGLLVRV